MRVDDIRYDFYFKIRGQKVLIIVNYDIDAICSCKILQSLFTTDNILYTLVPVDRVDDLKAVYLDYHSDEKIIILINCGGTIDLVEELEPEDDVVFYVIDSHRPTDICNVHSDGQVVLVHKLEDTENIPEFQDIFQDNEDEENEDNDDEEGSDEESQTTKRRKLNEEALLKRRDRRHWEERRDRLMFDYTQNSYYGRSSAVVCYELAHKLSKDSFDLLWYGIVGITEQMVFNKINYRTYLTECGDLQTHVSRLSHLTSQAEGETSRAVRINFDKDLRLALYRHWTVDSTLRNSSFSVTRLKLWTEKGEKRMHEMLAEIGIPLVQCKQKFSCMEVVYKKELHDSMVQMADKYGLDGIVYVSFIIQFGFRGKYSASDVVYGIFAILQSINNDKSRVDCFLEGLEALSRQRKEVLDAGIELAKDLLKEITKLTRTCLGMKQIQSEGPFLYFDLQDVSYKNIRSHPNGIIVLAQQALRSYAANTKNKKAHVLPLIVSVSSKQETNEDEQLCYIVAVAPVAEDSNKHFFGKAFEKAAENSKSEIKCKYFDSSVIELNLKDRSKFIDALAALLSS